MQRKTTDVHTLPARQEQISEIHALIRDSITVLCSSDHLNEPANLDHWLANRSPEKIEQIMFDHESRGFVCVENGTIVGVSHIRRDGELTLCYVHPEYTGQGVGSKILIMVESQARHWGVAEITLISTATAKPFYEAHGYQQYANEISYLRMPGYPLRKVLNA